MSGSDLYSPENSLNISNDLGVPSDTYIPENDLFLTDNLGILRLSFGETFSAQDVNTFSLSKFFSESTTSTASSVFKLKKNLAQSYTLIDTRKIFLDRTLPSSINISDSLDKFVGSSKAEVFAVNTEKELFLEKLLFQSSVYNDSVTREAEFNRSLSGQTSFLDISLSTFRKGLVEKPGLNDTETTFAEMFRNINASLNPNDADIKQVGKTLTQSVSSVDEFSEESTLRRLITEQSVFNGFAQIKQKKVLRESIDSTASFDIERELRRRAVDGFGFQNDVIKSSFSKAIAESIQLSSSESDLVILKRDVQDSFDISDNKQKLISSIIFEQSLITDQRVLQLSDEINESLSIVGNTNKLSARNLSEVISNNDVPSTNVFLTRNVQDSFDISDNEEKLISSSIFEELQITDQRILQLSHEINDSLSLAGNANKLSAQNLSEVISNSDVTATKSKLVRTENFSFENEVKILARLSVTAVMKLADSDIKDISKPLSESFNAEDNKEKRVFKSVSAEFSIDSLTTTFLQKQVVQRIDFKDVSQSLAFFFRSVSQPVSVNPLSSFELQTVKNERFNISSDTSKRVFKVLGENLGLENVVTSFEPAETIASTVEISRLRKAITEIKKK